MRSMCLSRLNWRHACPVLLLVFCIPESLSAIFYLHPCITL